MYQSPSYPDTSPLDQWKNKKYGLMFGVTPSPPPRRTHSAYSYRTESSLESSIPTPISDYKIKLSTSRTIPGGAQNFEIPITRALYLKLKNRSAISPITGELEPSEEIDYLTTLLINSLANTDDPHLIGMCYACGTKVSGEENGCLAFSRLYHVNCFTCVCCRKILRGSPFYIVNNQAYCHHDYLNTLEKCKGCSQPITDKIITADTDHYHAGCFNCHQCRTNLDGIPFANNKFGEHHCLNCFHQKYAPRCDRCEQPIAPIGIDKETVRINVLNKSFHTDCYKCQDCLLPLINANGEPEGCFPHTNLILCENCFNRRINLEAKANIRSVLK